MVKRWGVHNDDINDVKPLDVSSFAKWRHGDESNSYSMSDALLIGPTCSDDRKPIINPAV
jgi:hypothetical protein